MGRGLRMPTWKTTFGTAHTLYRLASISKSLTATATMQLFERGQLDLTHPFRNTAHRFRRSRGRLPPGSHGTSRRIRHYKSGSQDDPEVGNTKHFEKPIELAELF